MEEILKDSKVTVINSQLAASDMGALLAAAKILTNDKHAPLSSK